MSNEVVCGVLGNVDDMLVEIADFGNLTQSRVANALVKKLRKWYDVLCVRWFNVNMLRIDEKRSLCGLLKDIEKFLDNCSRTDEWFIDVDELRIMAERVGKVRRELCVGYE